MPECQRSWAYIPHNLITTIVSLAIVTVIINSKGKRRDES
jgi:hypothetical protein